MGKTAERVNDVAVTVSDHEVDHLAPEECELLVLLGAHAHATSMPAARRTTLEAYARAGHLWTSPHDNLRRIVSETLRSLRIRSLITMGDDGFQLTPKGAKLVQALEQKDRQFDERLDKTSVMIGDLQEEWHATSS